MDRSVGIGGGDGGRRGSECWIYPGDACEDGHAIAVFCYDIAGWRDVVHCNQSGHSVTFVDAKTQKVVGEVAVQVQPRQRRPRLIMHFCMYAMPRVTVCR